MSQTLKRPAPAEPRTLRLGIDIGGTKTAAVIVDNQGDIGPRSLVPTGSGADAVLAAAVGTVERVSAAAGIAPSALASIGIGIPGAVDHATGRVTHAVNLAVDALEIGPYLQDRFGVPVRVENDVKAAAVGAHHLLAIEGMPPASMAYLNLGTGLAAGVLLHGRLLRGGRGVAGEIGHLTVDPAGWPCGCGQIGCLETIASGSAITHMWPSNAALPAVDLFNAADAGDTRAIEVRERFLDGVATSVRAIVLAIDVDVILIGGGLAALGERLQSGVTRLLESRSNESAFLASLALPSRVRVIPSGFPAAAVGAALIGEH